MQFRLAGYWGGRGGGRVRLFVPARNLIAEKREIWSAIRRLIFTREKERGFYEILNSRSAFRLGD